MGASVGIFGFFGVPATLIIFEIIPFLVLAVGVDNIFILVQTYQREPRLPTETHPEHVGRIVGEVAPSMLLSSFSESTCFFLGALSDMPAVRAFALYAGMALLIDFVMQLTCFVSLLALDMARQENNRYDILCCIKASKKDTVYTEGTLYKVFKYLYAPCLLKKWVRPAVIILFFGWFCSSMAVVPKISVGLDQEISMPDNSFVLKYFEFLKTFLSVGPPFYVVVNSSSLQYDFTNEKLQNRICGTSGCDADSLQAQIKLWSLQSHKTYIASPAQSWIDDYFAWLSSSQCCSFNPDTLEVCQSNAPKLKKGKETTKRPSLLTTPAPVEKTTNGFFGDTFFDDDDGFGDFEDDEQGATEAPEAVGPQKPKDGDYLPDSYFSDYDQFYVDVDEHEANNARVRRKRDAILNYDDNCQSCETRGKSQRPTPEQFRRHLRWFLEDNPGEICPVAGQAAYRDCLRLTEVKSKNGYKQYAVNASSFMAFHSILKTSKDYTEALRWSRLLTDSLTESINKDLPEEERVEVFSYSIFYVFYEQYLTMWEDTLQSLGVSLLAIFVVTFVLMGMDVSSALIIILVILMILVNMGGLMYWWSIQLNAVSLVNLVMAVGISVEFCAHITRSFSVCVAEDKVARAKVTLVSMGSSVI